MTLKELNEELESIHLALDNIVEVLSLFAEEATTHLAEGVRVSRRPGEPTLYY